MPRKSQNLELLEMSGSQYEDLRTAQKQAAQSLSFSLAGTLRALLAKGWLVSVDGVIIPNPERSL
jgi:hypothetical protein